MDAAAKQRWNPAQYAENAAFVPTLGRPVVEWLAPAVGESILDLGCGDGALTAELGQLVGPSGRVLGVDASPEMVAAAQAPPGGGGRSVCHGRRSAVL